MDPDRTLSELRDVLFDLINQIDKDPANVNPADINVAIDLFCGLDGWLSGGGYLPRDWMRAVMRDGDRSG